MQAEKHQWLQTEIALLLLPTKKKRKERGKLVTVSLTLRSPKGGTATSMWMERTRLGPTGWGECSESALCRHWDSLNPTPLSFSTRLPQQLSHLLSSFPSISCSFISMTLERRKWKYGMCRQDTSLHAEQNWWTWKQLEESRFTRDTLTHLMDTYHALYVSV